MTFDGKRALARGKQVLELEAEAVRLLAEALHGPPFLRACELLLNCSGRVVVSGMGKAGLVGQKISATLASTGTPSSVPASLARRCMATSAGFGLRQTWCSHSPRAVAPGRLCSCSALSARSAPPSSRSASPPSSRARQRRRLRARTRRARPRPARSASPRPSAPPSCSPSATPCRWPCSRAATSRAKSSRAFTPGRLARPAAHAGRRDHAPRRRSPLGAKRPIRRRHACCHEPNPGPPGRRPRGRRAARSCSASFTDGDLRRMAQAGSIPVHERASMASWPRTRNASAPRTSSSAKHCASSVTPTSTKCPWSTSTAA